MKWIFLAAVLAVAPASAQSIYKCRDAKGGAVYQSQPCSEAEKRWDTEPRNVTDDAPPDGWPAWMPDGREILFASQRSGPFALFVMDAGGGAARRLTTPPAGMFDARPNVSPDGRKIVFNREQGNTIGILVLDLPAS